MTRKPTRRDIVRSSSIALGTAIVPADATARIEPDSQTINHKTDADVAVYNDGTSTETIRVNVVSKGSSGEPVFSWTVTLAGRNDPESDDRPMVGSVDKVAVPDAGEYTVVASTGDRTASVVVPMLTSGMAASDKVSVYLRPSEKLKAIRKTY